MSTLIIEGLITFLYYKDLEKASTFYEGILGFELTFDVGWAKIYKVADSAYVGIVDEKRGYHKSSPTKPVMITVVVPDVDIWYQYFEEKEVHTLTKPRTNEEIGIRSFLLEDPEGYVIEIQKFL